MEGKEEADEEEVATTKWTRQLELAHVLPVHSTVANPAAATALSLSVNQRKLYVGDAKGCVYAWGFPEGSGRSGDVHWVKDQSVGACMVRYASVQYCN